MAIAAAPSISLGPTHCHLCHAEGIGCSTSYAVTSNRIKSPFGSQRFSDCSGISYRCRSPFFGATQLHWLPVGREICLSKVSVAADYSDSFSDSSNYVHNHGYHPLEDLKVRKRIRDTKLTPAEIARTTVEANSSALLIFPSTVHCEPHEHISWAEFQYVIDEYGDIFFEIFDAENILQDRGASNPVNVLIGMDITTYENRRVAAAEYNILETGASDDMPFSDDYFEVEDNEMSDIPVEWGMPIDTASGVHPIYFAKCLTKVVNLEIMRIELFSIYGFQSAIGLQDFQEAEPDVLVYSTPAIVERFGEKGTRCNFALKALCKKKGLYVECCHSRLVLRLWVSWFSGVIKIGG